MTSIGLNARWWAFPILLNLVSLPLALCAGEQRAVAIEGGSAEPSAVTEEVIIEDVSSLPADTRSLAQRPQARNVILMIGDGMGPQQLSLLYAYCHYATNANAPDHRSAVERMAELGNVGMVRTEPSGVLVTDSAAAATQLASGKSAGSEMIGIDYHGNTVKTVLEIARDLGKATGLVSDTRITHATPAGFAAHRRHRSMENDIAVDMLASRTDVMLSGGLRHWVPQAVNERNSAAYFAVVQMIGGVFDPYSKRTDNRNLLLEARNDYQLVFDRTALAHAEQGKVLGLFANSEMLDAIAERNVRAGGDCTEPSLAEMAQKSLQLLNQNPQGFFVMVEGGQIDWAGHNNDAGDLLYELLRFNEAVQTVFDWARQRDDTLVLVTADHETGAFGFSYTGAEIPQPRLLPGNEFAGTPFAPDFNFGPRSVLDVLAQQRKSFYQIFSEFDTLAASEQTPEKLMELVNNAIAPLKITLGDATKLLTRRPNRFYHEGHDFLGTKTLPRMPDQEAFYVYGENLRMNRLGHILGEQQNVVWGSGTHTATPVAIISFGPDADRFTGIMHATDVGRRMIDIVRGK